MNYLTYISSYKKNNNKCNNKQLHINDNKNKKIKYIKHSKLHNNNITYTPPQLDIVLNLLPNKCVINIYDNSLIKFVSDILYNITICASPKKIKLYVNNKYISNTKK